MSDSTVVLYHASCADGYGAAFAAWGALGDAATYIPVQYGQEPPAEAWGARRLFILDFSYPRAVLERLAASAGEVLVLDHHKTAEADLAGLPYARFDQGKSGAVLAWEHFHPGEAMPLLLAIVQDRDLWRWELPYSREFSAALALEPRDFARWSVLADRVEGPGGQEWMMRRGEVILAAQAAHVAGLCDRAFMTDVGGHMVPAVNSPLFQSEVGEELCRRHPDAPFAAAFSCPNLDEEIWSLRSRGGFDVSAVARALGGGGHKAAAGFRKRRDGAAAPALLAALREVEWAGIDPHGRPYCPSCRYVHAADGGPGHDEDCTLAAAIRAAGGR